MIHTRRGRHCASPAGRRRLRIGGVLVTLGLIVAACGSDEAASPETAPSDASAEDPAVSGESSDADVGVSDDCASDAAQMASAASAPVALKVPPGPIDLEAVDGKSVALILIVNNELGQSIADGFEEAAAAVGIDGSVFDAQGDATLMNTGVAQAVSSGADAIILYGIDPGIVSEPLRQAADADTILLDIFNRSPEAALPDGFFAQVTPDFTRSGENMAAWMLADSGCDVNAAIFGASVLTIHNEMTAAASATLEEMCPDCSAIVEDVNLATLATDLGPNVAATLDRDPDVNYLFLAFDGGIPLVLPAIEGFDGVLLGHDGVPSSLEDIRNGGTGQQVTGAFPPGGWIGYALVDQVARAFGDEEPADWTIPIRIIDETNVGETDADLFPDYVDFEGEFVSTWGAS